MVVLIATYLHCQMQTASNFILVCELSVRASASWNPQGLSSSVQVLVKKMSHQFELKVHIHNCFLPFTRFHHARIAQLV